MKLSFSILLFLLLSANIHGQKNPDKYNLLWEISGGEFTKPCFLFGSLHLNDNRLFDFPDSLLIALKSCKIFAGELDYANIDSLLEIEVMNTLLNDSIRQSKSSSGDLSDIFSQEGYPTFVDLYLYNISRNLGLKSIGLERWEDQKDILNAMSTSDYEHFFKDSVMIEQFIKTYANGNLEEINKLMISPQLDGLDVLEMDSRNLIQAESFIKSGIKQPTFAVIGAAHLTGDNNVLDILKKRKYQIRPIKYTKSGSALHDIYKNQKNETLHEISSSTFPYSILAFGNSPINFFNNIDFHVSFKMDRGMMFITMGLPVTTAIQVTNPDLFIQTLVTSLSKDSSLILGKPYSTKKDKSIEYRRFKLQNDKTNMMLQSAISEDVVVVQLATGFSKNALNVPFIEQYFNGLKIAEIAKGWSMETNKQGNFAFFSGSPAPFLKNELKEHAHR